VIVLRSIEINKIINNILKTLNAKTGLPKEKKKTTGKVKKICFMQELKYRLCIGEGNN